MSFKNHEESGYGLKNNEFVDHLVNTNRMSHILGEVANIDHPNQ